MRQLRDTKYESLESTLSAIGKATFVQFYYDFKGNDLSIDELAEKIYLENPRARSSRQNFRIPRAKHIFQHGLQLQALEIIIASKQVDPKTRSRAQEILILERTSHSICCEKADEQEFIAVLNEEITAVESSLFEYDNSPRKPKVVQTQETKKYPRSRVVAMNALRAACFLCEVDQKHPLFKRKNCDINYTEPHHLVPLSAFSHFPDVDLDREQNVVSLCSNCHNWLHYGSNIDEILQPLFVKRQRLLQLIGINISYEELRALY